LALFFQMFTYWSSSFIVHGSYLIAVGQARRYGVSAQEYPRTPHNWLDLRFCAKFGGFFSGGNGVSRYK